MSSSEEIIVQHVKQLAGSDAAIGRDTPLLELGLLDSINLVGLIQFVEDRFGIRIPDEEIGADLFATPRSLAAYVASRQGSATAAAR